MKLTRENTCLDLSKLTEGELEFLKVPKHISKASKNGFIHYAHLYDREKPELGIGWCCDFLVDRDRLSIVDFQTFKSIHFPESETKQSTKSVRMFSETSLDDIKKVWDDLEPITQKDLDPTIAKIVDDNLFDLIDNKPTYEELVEALREVNRVFTIRPAEQDTEELEALWIVDKLLERIKS